MGWNPSTAYGWPLDAAVLKILSSRATKRRITASPKSRAANGAVVLAMRVLSSVLAHALAVAFRHSTVCLGPKPATKNKLT